MTKYSLFIIILSFISLQEAYSQNTRTQLPPPPPILDQSLINELADTRRLSGPQRAAVIEEQRTINQTLRPLRPEQILQIQRDAHEQERLLNSVDGGPRKTIDRDMPWSIGLGAQRVHLGIGYITTLLFFDAQGNPVPVSPTGAVVGDQAAVDANATGNAVVLYVKEPWRSTNLAVFLVNQPVPLQFNLTSDRNAATPIDGQIRVRIINANAISSLDRQDMQNVNTLLQLTNGVPVGLNMSVLQVVSVEKGDPSRLNWVRIPNNIAQFRVGPDSLTYVLLRPGFNLLYPNVPNVFASLRGADGTEGYIVGGNNPRVFTVQDQQGSLYRITVQR